MCLKDADQLTNCVDPDQTAPEEAVWSGSALFAQLYLSKYLQLLSTPMGVHYVVIGFDMEVQPLVTHNAV